MHETATRDERAGRARRAAPDLSRARRSPSPGLTTSPGDVLGLQNLIGNQAVNRVFAIQRASRRGSPSGRGYASSDDSDLAYGSAPGSSRSSSVDSGLAYGRPAGTSSPSFSASVDNVRFSAGHNGNWMREICYFVADVARRLTSAVPSLTVQFGRTQGGRPGEWRQDSRTIMLDPRHPEARSGSDSLAGTAVFELLNASASSRITELENSATNGYIEQRADQEGITPERYFAREALRIEHDNILAHQAIMARAGRGGTSADRFAGVTGHFGTFHAQQEEQNFTHSYEFRYHYLRTRATAASSSRHQEAGSSSRSSSGSSSSHRCHRSRR